MSSSSGKPASDSRLQILHAAAGCFMERGFHATSIDHVAHRLGATKGIVYHHYQSKMDLFFDVYRVGMTALLSAVSVARQGPGRGLASVRAMLEAHAMAMFEFHAFENVVAQGVQLHRFSAMTPSQRESFDELVASRDRLEQMYKEEVEMAQSAGTVRADLDVSIAVKTILGGVHWSVIWWRPEADEGLQARHQLAQKMVDVLLHGLEPR
ncbi:MAG: TetR/AcrR family transcriptional regulator [Ottowia sp.]|uniref:TetR/AcrR family transcriptional regulator n=1 Tax=Ottowia sp. TaxID=1898956 RepID=UPI003C7599AD